MSAGDNSDSSYRQEDIRIVIIVFGLPATGKSYFSRHLAAETGAAYLNTDIVRKELNLQGLEFSEADLKVYLQIKYHFERMEQPHLVLQSDAPAEAISTSALFPIFGVIVTGT